MFSDPDCSQPYHSDDSKESDPSHATIQCKHALQNEEDGEASFTSFITTELLDNPENDFTIWLDCQPWSRST